MTTEHDEELHIRLQDEHLAQLRASGIADEVMLERGYRSAPSSRYRKRLGFRGPKARPGLLLPLRTVVDGDTAYCILRPDEPRLNRDGKPIKYETPAGAAMRLDCPPRCREGLGDPSVPLWITEGQKKADALASRDQCAIALLGVWNWRGKNALGGTTVLADWEYVHLKGRDVRVVYDSDVVTKEQVQKALARLAGFLEGRGARVRVAYLPEVGEGKTGVDDWLVAGHTVAELEGLLEPLRSRARTAPPIQVEILDEEPQTLRRPLALLDGRAYAALSLPCRVSREGGGNGQAAPTREWRPFVLRDDGRLFGAGADEPLEALGFAVELPPLPRNARTFSPRAVKRYREGYRPEDVAGLVGRVAGVYDHFIDFGRSLGSQGEMCRLAACLSLATYFLPAWTVIGYLWFTGEKGAGKSQAGTVWALTSYLGRVVLSSGTFAALRDLAEAGAALVFDDAEVLADPRKADPNKRELALAGNRRGVQVPLKERQGDNWVLRWVDAFAPRAFTAIARPEDVLASRCIVVPLVRTADRGRANRDAVAERYWPANAQALVDDCWMLALWLLPEAEAVWAELDGEGEMLGRDLEPWRAALATARLLDRHGAPGLEGTVRAVMARYREERADYWADDHTGAVVRVLVEHVEEQLAAGGGPRPGADTLDTLDTADTSPGYVLSASAIAQRIQQGAAAEGEEEHVREWATPTRIGITLRNLRLRKERGADRKRTRGWRFTLADVRALATAYGVQTSLGEGATPTMGGPSTAHCTPSGEVSRVSRVSRVSAGAHDAPGDGRQGNPSGVVGE